MPKWLVWLPAILITVGLLLTAASDTAGNIVVLVGGLGLVWVGLTLWTNPSLFSGGPGNPRLWAALLIALGVSFAVTSVIALS